MLIGLAASDDGEPVVLGESDAAALIADAEVGRAIPRLAEAVRTGQVHLPVAAATRLEALDRTVQETSLFIERTANRVIALLEGHGIEPTVLKGLATSYLDHAGPHLRQIGDVDLLIAPSDLDAAERLLAEAGYTLVDREGEGAAAKSSTMRSPEGIEVDLHRMPARWRYGRWVLEGHVPTETVSVSSLPWRVLPRPDRFVHAVVHYVQDGKRLSSVADAVALWPTPEQHDEWVEAIGRWNAATAVSAFRTMVRSGFGVDLAPIPGCDPVRGRWLGRGLANGGAPGVLANRVMVLVDLPRAAALRDAVRFAFPDRQWMEQSGYPNRRARFTQGVRATLSMAGARRVRSMGDSTPGSVR